MLLQFASLGLMLETVLGQKRLRNLFSCAGTLSADVSVAGHIRESQLVEKYCQAALPCAGGKFLIAVRAA